MTIFYFSATGNSLAVAKRIGGKLVSIPQIMDAPETQYSDDVIGLIFPIYGFHLPKPVLRFLNKVKFDAPYIFAIGTYGNSAGATMRNLQSLAKKRGYRFDYATSLLMVDNYLPLFEIDNQIAKLPVKKTDESLARILDDIKNQKTNRATASLLTRALTASIVLFEMTFLGAKFARRYLVDDKCTKCGVCSRVCPVNNIAVTERVQFGDRCALCMACIHHCPQNAIHLKSEKSVKRWKHPDVSVKEIIAANDRLGVVGNQ